MEEFCEVLDDRYPGDTDKHHEENKNPRLEASVHNNNRFLCCNGIGLIITRIACRYLNLDVLTGLTECKLMPSEILWF